MPLTQSFRYLYGLRRRIRPYHDSVCRHLCAGRPWGALRCFWEGHIAQFPEKAAINHFNDGLVLWTSFAISIFVIWLFAVLYIGDATNWLFVLLFWRIRCHLLMILVQPWFWGNTPPYHYNNCVLIVRIRNNVLIFWDTFPSLVT